MNNRIHTTIILAAAAFAACSGSERADIVPATETSRIMLVREGAADVSVYAFRRQGAVFLFDTLFREGWTPDGKLSVRMPNGHYKFLFASGAADRIALQPAPLTRQTSWEEAAFVLRENAAMPGTCFPADELFLQYPASDANTVYTIDGAAQTVRARLTRAVCRSPSNEVTTTARDTSRVPMPNRNPCSTRSAASNSRPTTRACA